MSPSHRVFFVDTSYLLELYRVPGFHDGAASAVIREKFRAARERGDRRFVPLGCLFETGNHIAGLNTEAHRAKWANVLLKDVVAATDDALGDRPFVLVPAPALHEVRALIASWADRHCSHARGLVDTAIAEAATTFKKTRAMGAPVHIWTRDRALKGLEPDAEADAFV